MGYTTHHKLSTENATEEQNEKLSYMFENEVDEYGVDWSWTIAQFNGEYIGCETETKWYKHEREMIILSSQPEFKDVLFILEGSGEDNGDMWIQYFKNGKNQRIQAQLVFEEFDENKMT